VLCHVSSTYPPLGSYPHPRRLLVHLGGVGVRGLVAAACNVLGGERDLSLSARWRGPDQAETGDVAR
jgi:hypothetical protein